MGKTWTFRMFERAADMAGSGGRTDENPSRGFYHVYTFDITSEEKEEDWVWSLVEGERLALVLLDIGKCACRRISSKELSKAGRIFSFFKSHGRQMILRVVYDAQGHGPESEPDDIGRIVCHMRQLGPVIGAFDSHIFTLQGLWVGSWGEMHSSRFLEKGHLELLYDTLRRETGGGIVISVRKPQYQRMLAGPEGKIAAGLYDDAILASDTDMGTFGWLDDTNDRDSMWTPGLELEFIERCTRHLPCGGEMLSGALRLPWNDAVERMRQMHLTYLNRVHEPALWNAWESMQAGSGQSGPTRLDFVRQHLGYRYELLDLQVRGGPDAAYVLIQNSGFACCYDEMTLELAIGGLVYRQKFPVQDVAPGERAVVRVPVCLASDPDSGFAEPLLVQVGLRHDKTGLVVYFANEYPDERTWARYSSSSSLSDGIAAGVLSTENAAI